MELVGKLFPWIPEIGECYEVLPDQKPGSYDSVSRETMMLPTYVTDFIDMVHIISKNVRTFLLGYSVDYLQE